MLYYVREWYTILCTLPGMRRNRVTVDEMPLLRIPVDYYDLVRVGLGVDFADVSHLLGTTLTST